MGDVIDVCKRRQFPAVIVNGREGSQRDYVLRELIGILTVFYSGCGFTFSSTSREGESRWKRPKLYFNVFDPKGNKSTRVAIEERRDGVRTLKEDSGRDYAASPLTRYSPCFAIYFDSQRDERFFRNKMKRSGEQGGLEGKIVNLEEFLIREREKYSYVQRDLFHNHLKPLLESKRRAENY